LVVEKSSAFFTPIIPKLVISTEEKSPQVAPQSN
jgi:hypothetical protein